MSNIFNSRERSLQEQKRYFDQLYHRRLNRAKSQISKRILKKEAQLEAMRQKNALKIQNQQQNEDDDNLMDALPTEE